MGFGFAAVAVFLLAVIAFFAAEIRDELRDIVYLLEQEDSGAPVPRRRVRRP